MAPPLASCHPPLERVGLPAACSVSASDWLLKPGGRPLVIGSSPKRAKLLRGSAGRRSLVRSSPRPSAAVSGPAPLRNVAGSAQSRRGRAARWRLLGGADRSSALGDRRPKS